MLKITIQFFKSLIDPDPKDRFNDLLPFCVDIINILQLDFLKILLITT